MTAWYKGDREEGDFYLDCDIGFPGNIIMSCVCVASFVDVNFLDRVRTEFDEKEQNKKRPLEHSILRSPPSSLLFVCVERASLSFVCSLPRRLLCSRFC